MSYALQAPRDAYKTVLPWEIPFTLQLTPYKGIKAVLRAPIRVYSGKDCGSCSAPIDRDGVCKCSS
jgi:hypothetical protein